MSLKPELIIDALTSLEGKGSLAQIYKAVQDIAEQKSIILPPSYQSSIRGRIEERSSDSDVWKKSKNRKEDLFYSVYGLGDGVWGLRSMQGMGEDLVFDDPAEASIEAEEGRRLLKWHLKRERSQKLIREFKKRLKLFQCAVCGFSFKDKYGDLGEGFIEAHHIVPLSKTRDRIKTRISDLIPVCSNCHRMLHVRAGTDHDKLRSIISQNESN